MIEKCQFDISQQGLFWSIKQFENSLRSITRGFQLDKNYERNKGILKVNQQIEHGLCEIAEYFIFLKKLFPQLEQAQNYIIKSEAKLEDDQVGYNYKEPFFVKLEENVCQKNAKKRGPYRYYSYQERTKVIELNLSGQSYAKISKGLKIPQKNIVRWCKEGLQTIGKRKRTIDTEMEKSLLVWIEECRQNRQNIKLIDLQRKALQIKTTPFFKANRGWITYFMKRYNLQFKVDRK